VRRPVPLLGVLGVAASLAAGCDADGAVALAFRPAEGAELAYETDVESTTVTDVPCQAPSSRTDRATLRADHRVLEVGADGVRVEVALSRAGIGTRTFVVRFDRAAQLTTIEEVEGIPAAALGELGLSEVFPAAAGAPPDRPLAPGDRWAIDDEVRLDADGEPTRLRGEGRLVALGVEDGRDTATVETTTVLPVSTSTASPTTGTRELDGEQVTEVTATYDLADGALLRARSVTVGTFDLVLGPPPGGAGDECAGSLDVEVRSDVRRVG
jgi:hypothetical protein